MGGCEVLKSGGGGVGEQGMLRESRRVEGEGWGVNYNVQGLYYPPDLQSNEI